MPVTRRKRANPPEEPEGNNNRIERQNGNAEPPVQPEQTASPNAHPAGADQTSVEQPPATAPYTPPPYTPPAPPLNGDRAEYAPAPESVRRSTFRRPAQQPTSMPPQYAQPAQPAPAPSAPTATHEITLPLGNLLHLAYNPAYTNSEEARSVLLHRLANESKAGGRGRCWNCGSLAINYDTWNTRSRSFGEVGIAFCEVCGVWSVL